MNRLTWCRALAAVALVSSIALPTSVRSQATQRLRGYNVDPATVSVSGASSGGNMAIQLAVAYGSRIAGVGVFSAAPYDCFRSGAAAITACEGFQTPDIEPLDVNMRRWSGREIDDVASLARQRAYVFVGRHDNMYSATVVSRTAKLIERFVGTGNLLFESSIDAGHMIPADFDNPLTSNNWKCASPIAGIANCDYDGAGALLQWIYGPLAKRNAAIPVIGYQSFDQGEFATRSQGMDVLGLAYVPAACESGAPCRLHVFLHACNQSWFTRGDDYMARYSGHTRWAETNNIIVLFPQTYPDETLNPQGCWDDRGRFDDRYDQKGGPQIEAIMAMVSRITSAFAGAAAAVEYYHAAFDHYFVSADAGEVAALDSGKFQGWKRTGESFHVYQAGAAGAVPVCRFFSVAFGEKSSHFYTPVASECALRKSDPSWQYEGEVFAAGLPDASGTCAPGLRPLYRMYNDGQGGAPNHRYTTSLAVRADTLSKGWIGEGYGDRGVIACVPT